MPCPIAAVAGCKLAWLDMAAMFWAVASDPRPAFKSCLAAPNWPVVSEAAVRWAAASKRPMPWLTWPMPEVMLAEAPPACAMAF